MPRLAVALIVGCLYIAVSVWIVRSEGESYRESLRRAKAEAKPAAPTVATQEEPVNSALDATHTASTPDRETTSSPALEHVADVAKTKDAAKANTVQNPPPVTPAEVPRPAPEPKLDPYLSSPELDKVWDLAHLSTDDEVLLGQQLHELVMHFNVTAKGSPWLRKIEEAAAPLLEGRARKDIRYKFTLLDSEAMCAFSHPGGYVYVCRGLFNLIGEDEDYALQFVLGHEIAHVDLKHALKDLDAPGVKQLKLGTAKAYMALIAPMAYTDDQEFEADAWALQHLRRLDRTRYEVLIFMRRFEGYSQDHEFADGRMPPAPGASLFENHFRAHPAAWKRLQKLKELWGHK